MSNICLMNLSAVLLVNYDMQWTAIRYIQQCENYRKDLITINLSMMTYKWFKHKHIFYPTLKFPGEIYSNTYLPPLKTSKKSKKNKKTNDEQSIVREQPKESFTLFEFVALNENVNIYLSGKLGEVIYFLVCICIYEYMYMNLHIIYTYVCKCQLFLFQRILYFSYSLHIYKNMHIYIYIHVSGCIYAYI